MILTILQYLQLICIWSSKVNRIDFDTFFISKRNALNFFDFDLKMVYKDFIIFFCHYLFTLNLILIKYHF
jgi:hypothetical protein